MMVPGVRVESASFSLSLPALLNAYTTAVSVGRGRQVCGLALSRTLRPSDVAYVESLVGVPLQPVANDLWLRGGHVGDMPEPMSVVDPRVSINEMSPNAEDPDTPDLSVNKGISVEKGIELARTAARRALVPSSNFQVGAVLETPDGDLFPGANVEHPDWARILCAERNAAGTARTYGQPAAQRVFLTCIDDDQGTPCGACRQVLAELTPDAALWMDRHEKPAEHATPESLLPRFFQGRSLM